MAKRRTRILTSVLLGGAVFVGCGAVYSTHREAIHFQLEHRRERHRTHEGFIGWRYVQRSEGYVSGPYAYWDPRTGCLTRNGIQWTRETHRDARGVVFAQWDYDERRSRRKPPWFWREEDELEPSAPWISEGISAERWLGEE